MQPAFETEFCRVEYLVQPNIVLLTWKRFCVEEAYRRPTLAALALLQKYPGSNFVIDARNGFEDEQADIDWAFAELLPQMAKTACRHVAFWMQKSSAIEEEMDLWGREFGKYFTVHRVESLAAAEEAFAKAAHATTTG